MRGYCNRHGHYPSQKTIEKKRDNHNRFSQTNEDEDHWSKAYEKFTSIPNSASLTIMEADI